MCSGETFVMGLVSGQVAGNGGTREILPVHGNIQLWHMKGQRYLCLYVRFVSRSFNTPSLDSKMIYLSRKIFSDETMKKVNWVTIMFCECH